MISPVGAMDVSGVLQRLRAKQYSQGCPASNNQYCMCVVCVEQVKILVLFGHQTTEHDSFVKLL